jgi:hypothetical protein
LIFLNALDPLVELSEPDIPLWPVELPVPLVPVVPVVPVVPSLLDEPPLWSEPVTSTRLFRCLPRSLASFPVRK